MLKNFLTGLFQKSFKGKTVTKKDLSSVTGVRGKRVFPSVNRDMLMQYCNDCVALEKDLKAGMDCNAKEPAFGWAMLHVAAKNGKVEIVKLLIKHGADVNIQTRSGVTPLLNAAIGGHDEIVAALIAAGAKLDLKDRATNTSPIVQAVINGHSKIVKQLIDAGADLNVTVNGKSLPDIARMNQLEDIALLISR